MSEHFSARFQDQALIRIDTEFLDAKRRPSLDHADTFLQLLREKYATNLPDVLVISDDPAFDLLWPIHEELLPGVPIVFMGLNSVRPELTSGARGITGVFEQHSTEATTELALKLTSARGIIVINDTSETGKANEVKLAEMVTSYPDIEWVIERDLNIGEIDRIAALPDDWPIIPMLPMRELDGPGSMYSQRRSVQLLREQLPNPLFYDSDWMIGSGLVGGYILSGEDHAAQASELALSILEGSAPEDLPVRLSNKQQWVFDQRELDRFGWSRDQFPDSALFLYSESSFWEQHKKAIYPLLAALAALALVIVVLIGIVNRQRKTESLLREQEQRLATALAATHAGVFEIRPDRRYASPRWLELTASSTLHEEADSDWMEHATEASRKEFNQAIRHLCGTSHLERLELTINHKSSRILDVLLTRAPDRPGAIVGVATDVTVTRQIEQESARRNRLEMLGALAAGIAHDFNNFLLVIKLSAEMAKELNDPDEMRELIVEIEHAGVQATDIVKQLLAFGSPDPTPDKVIEATSAVQEIHPFLQRMLGMQGEVISGLYCDPVGLRISRTQLERILSNLVVNARDAMPNGGNIYVDVRTQWVVDTERVVISVRDEGEGMDQTTSDRIFEPFYSTKTVNKGTGLGLSTVYGIVTGSGGEISVSSKPGQGTTFELSWPSEPLVYTSQLAESNKSPTLDDVKILLVEDDLRVGPITQKLLEQAGSDTTLAKDGQEGLDIFSSQPDKFDLILSDVVLPEMNGIDMVANIRRIRPSVRVGFLSGYTDHPSLEGARLPGEVELLRKPYSKKDLDLFVERQLSA